ncbi:ketopantoate reductase family protein [Mycolicibacterium goodii]|uniref:2-dehydropantoate 2-reductase n=1 Tax=Mycolicibacterium goodii TaxID=134601 RepID=A0A0K0X8X7_MYCGD|nr:hypothetical protein AFA91_20345 [Mycolicibacterium goodii]
MSGEKIAVLGSGANGASVGADLTRAGLDVTLIEQWPEHVEAMRRNGIEVRMPHTTETTDVRAFNLCDVATFRHAFDIVLVMVKAYDTRWACELIKPVLADEGVVVGVQNGMTVDPMIEVLGADRVLGCVIEVASNMFEPGIVNRDTTRERSWFAVGGVTEAAHQRAEAIAEILRNSGQVEVSDDIRSSKWMKLIANCTELVTSAILDMTVMDAAKVPGMYELMIEAGNEATRTAIALGHQLRPIIGMAEADITAPERFAAALFDIVHDVYSTPTQLTTVLQDWHKGRRSEVNEINGHVVREQARLGGRAPVNEAVVQIASRIESGDLTAGPDVADLLMSSAARLRARSR